MSVKPLYMKGPQHSRRIKEKSGRELRRQMERAERRQAKKAK